MYSCSDTPISLKRLLYLIGPVLIHKKLLLLFRNHYHHHHQCLFKLSQHFSLDRKQSNYNHIRKFYLRLIRFFLDILAVVFNTTSITTLTISPSLMKASH